MNELILLIRTLIDTAIVILIWLVQFIIYPAYHHIEKNDFSQWHYNYMQSISYFVMPLMLAQGFIIIYQCFHRPSYLVYLSAFGILIAWLSTFIYSVPCHNVLQQDGYNEIITNRLILTNWIRTISWTVVLIFGIISCNKTL